MKVTHEKLVALHEGKQQRKQVAKQLLEAIYEHSPIEVLTFEI